MSTVLALSLLCFRASFASAEVPVNPPAEVSPGLQIVDVVRQAVRDHPDVHMQAATIAAAEARVQERAGAFDVVLTSLVGHDHTESGFDTQERLAYPGQEGVTSEQTRWRVGAQKLLGFGLSLQTFAEVERREQVGLQYATEDGEEEFPSVGRARLALSATQALLRGRGSDTGPAALEAIAEMTVQAEGQRLLHTKTTRALVAVNAYWDYVAAHRRVAILQASEARAKALLAEVQLLIEKDERPAAEAVHFKSLYADRQASRAVAEIALVRTRQAIGLAMGLPPGEIQTLLAPSDPLPHPDPSWRLASGIRDALVERGVSRRADLAAAQIEVKAADLAVHAADRDREPRLDLQLSLGYTGLEESEGYDTLFTPLAGQVGGPDVGVSLVFAWPVENRTLLGRVARRSALLERARLALAELARTVRAEIEAGAQSLDLEIRAYEAAKASVALHEQTVLNQRRRLRSELSTAIDVLITEERLTGARIAALQSEVRYAQALSRLRFATASLLPDGSQNEALTADRLTQPPRGEGD